MTPTSPRKAVSDAVDELERRLRPYVPDANRLLFAEQFVDWLTEQRWRHVPAPVTDWHKPAAPPDPEVGHRGAEMVRRALEEGGGRS